jgi:hypothetical protein
MDNKKDMQNSCPDATIGFLVADRVERPAMGTT